MPRGTYRHHDGETGEPGARGRFSGAPGPSGWRYVADVADPSGGSPLGRVDVTVDSRWRQLRGEGSSGGWLLRGGSAGREVPWLRQPFAGADPGELSERSAVAAAFSGRSPAFVI